MRILEKSLTVCLALLIALMAIQARAANLTYPADFTAGTSMQDAVHDARLAAGETLTVTGYMSGQNHLTGFWSDNGVNVKSSGGILTIRGAADSDFANVANGTPVVYSGSGATIEGFIIEVDHTSLSANHFAVFVGDNGGGTFNNCTMRFINQGPAADAWLVSAVAVYGANPAAPVTLEGCTIEQVNAGLPDGNNPLFVVQAGYRPTLNNCTIKGRGQSASDRYGVALVAGSADFNGCHFINDSATWCTIFIEGNGQTCTLTDCDFTNPDKNFLAFNLRLGVGGEAGPASYIAKRCEFHASDGSAYPQTRFLLFQRTDGLVSFENCSIFYSGSDQGPNGSQCTGHPDGSIIFENHGNGTLRFRHCTLVDLFPAWNMRFIQSQGLTGGSTIEFTNNIIDDYADGNLGLIYIPDGSPAPTIISSNNIRHIGAKNDAYPLNRAEGDTGFVEVDPLLQADRLHLELDSPAIMAAAASGIHEDINGSPRPAPAGTLPDIGAVEDQTVPVEISSFSVE